MLKLKTEGYFSSPVRRFALLALLGVYAFLSALVLLHMLSDEIDLVNDYVSNLANEPQGWLFRLGAFVHGWGNLALALGLRSALQPERLRTWGVLLLAIAAAGILLTSIFSMDPAGQNVSIDGRIHRIAASAAFLLELAALFVFSLIFALSRQPHWYRRRNVSLVLTVLAALAVMWFVIAFQIGVAQGLAERAALTAMMSWELWAIWQLFCAPPPKTRHKP